VRRVVDSDPRFPAVVVEPFFPLRAVVVAEPFADNGAVGVGVESPVTVDGDDGGCVVGGVVTTGWVVGGGSGPHTSLNDTNRDGGVPVLHVHASTSPSCTCVSPAPATEYVYCVAPATARK